MNIDITFDAHGKASAHPDQCHVKKGAKVTMQTAAGVETPFFIDFGDESPVDPGGPKKMSSKKDGSRQRIDFDADNLPADKESKHYKYAIKANDIIVDPAIIIDR